ncbi:MAG: hypothetical protein Tsb009_37980 [Planctomycetaceae bacterium]
MVLEILILWASASSPHIREICGPAVANVFDPEVGRLSAYFSGVCLFLSGQLALLIWWVRSRSKDDFSGKYRIWAWAAGFSFGAALTVSLDLHHVWAATLLWRWEFGFAHQETWLWLAPAIGCASAVLWEIRKELHECRMSHSLFWLAVISWSMYSGVALGAPFGWETVSRELILAATSMLGYLSLFTSLMLHARHVIYVSPEPPREEKTNRLLIVIRRLLLFPKLIFSRIGGKKIRREDIEITGNTDDDSEPDLQEAMVTEPQSAEASVSEDVQSSPVNEIQTANREEKTREQEDSGAEEHSEITGSGMEIDKAKIQSAETMHRIDAPADNSQPTGPSKRERRKQRKRKRNRR